MEFWKARKATPPTIPCGKSRWGSCHWGGTFDSSMAHQSHLVKRKTDVEMNQKSKATIGERLNNAFHINRLQNHPVGLFFQTSATDCTLKQQSVLQTSPVQIHFQQTQPPRLWGSYSTRNLGGFFMPAVLARSTSTGRMQ